MAFSPNLLSVWVNVIQTVYILLWNVCLCVCKDFIKGHSEKKTTYVYWILATNFKQNSSIFIYTGFDVLLWGCTWSCRPPGWACPGRTGSTHPCHWRWSSPHTVGNTWLTSLIERVQRERETSQENPTICTWKDSRRELRDTHKFRSHRSTPSSRSGSPKAGICSVAWSQPWSQIWPSEWNGFVSCIFSITFDFYLLWASETTGRSEWWRFKSYQK